MSTSKRLEFVVEFEKLLFTMQNRGKRRQGMTNRKAIDNFIKNLLIGLSHKTRKKIEELVF